MHVKKLFKIFKENAHVFGTLIMSPPPVYSFRLLQLPIKNRAQFGKWLNVSFDEQAAVNVLATSLYEIVDAEKRKGFRVMHADSMRDIKLRGTTAALIVSKTASLLDYIDKLEEDYDLPRGVKSRRQEMLSHSIYWSYDITPQTVDKHNCRQRNADKSL